MRNIERLFRSNGHVTGVSSPRLPILKQERVCPEALLDSLQDCGYRVVNAHVGQWSSGYRDGVVLTLIFSTHGRPVTPNSNQREQIRQLASATWAGQVIHNSASNDWQENIVVGFVARKNEPATAKYVFRTRPSHGVDMHWVDQEQSDKLAG